MAITDQVEAAVELVNTISARIATPLLILFIGIALGKLLGNLVDRFLQSVEFDKHAKEWLGRPAGYAELVAGGLAAIVYTVSVVWALVSAGIIVQTLWVILGFLTILAAVSVLLAARDFLPDLYAGIAVRRAVEKGKKLSCAGVSGTVERVGRLDVRLRTEDSLLMVVPNRTVKKCL